MTFQKKNLESAVTAGKTETEGPRIPRGYADGKRYLGALVTIKTLQDQLEGVEKGLAESVGEVTAIEEARRQEGATFAFDLKMKRDAQLAAFAKEDATREAEFTGRDQALAAAEADFGELLGVTPDAGDHLSTGKALRIAFDAAIKNATAAGEAGGKTAEAAKYAIQKRIDVAEAAKDLELLKQKNAQLEKENGELKVTNARLLDAQAATNATVADVAKTGLNAAAGITAKGQDALTTSAGAFPGGSQRGR